MTIPKLRFAAAVSLAPLLAGCIPGDEKCGARECDGALLLLVYPTSANPSLDGGTLRVCHNDRCNEETIVTDATSLQGLGLARPFDTQIRLDSATFHARGMEVRIGVANDDAKDGDMYSIELRNSSGVEVARRSWPTATYRETNPFGPECGGITCRSVYLE